MHAAASPAHAAAARWGETAGLLGLPLPAEHLDDLVARYGEPHRAYHDLAHVLDCLRQAREVRACFAAAGAAELALWYHDAVYDPRRGDNEERSAALAAAHLGERRELAAAVGELVLATRHDRPPASADAALVADIDLSVLGAPEEAFDAYDRAVREEYRWVPAPLYRRRRREVLRAFLARPRIYATDLFAARLEGAARANLARAVARLS